MPETPDEFAPNVETNRHRLAFTRTQGKKALGGYNGAYCTAPDCRWGQKFVKGWRVTEARADFQVHLHSISPKLGDTAPLPFGEAGA